MMIIAMITRITYTIVPRTITIRYSTKYLTRLGVDSVYQYQKILMEYLSIGSYVK
jgi:hypothetical protein